MHAFQGRILVVDAGKKSFDIIEKGEAYYRKYVGGALLCAALYDELAAESKPADALSSENPIVFATGPMAGGAVCGATRVNVLSMAPESKGTYLSQAGGEFGPAMKRAGFDALAVIGQAAEPMILNITHQSVTFLETGMLWGQDRLATYHRLIDTHGKDAAVASIGPAGEHLVRHANIMFEPDHYAGRGGLGAVLGAKRIKAIVVNGKEAAKFSDPEAVKRLNREGGRRCIEALKQSPGSFMGVLHHLGTFGLLEVNQMSGNLPSCNFRSGWPGVPEAVEVFSQKTAGEKFVGNRTPCKHCYLACKKRSKAKSGYSSLAEYESVATLGPNLGLMDDLETALEASELCNRMGLDTISTGNMIAWLMDCFEHGALKKETLDVDIFFGEGRKAIELIEAMALRKTELGNLLADGIEKAAERLGPATVPYLRFVKGMGLPAHMPRKKPGVGFGYLHGPNAADHMKLEHDWIASDKDSLATFNLDILSTADALDQNKIAIAKTTQTYYAAIDTLSLCLFIFGPGNIYSFEEITEMVSAATGWDWTFEELMTIGERAIQLQRKLFLKFGGGDENFLSFLSTPIPDGPSKGACISEEDFNAARRDFYRMMGWDENGMVLDETLKRLGLAIDASL